MSKSVVQNNSTLLLYTGENEVDGYNYLIYWIPEFLKSRIEFGILVRNSALYKKIKNDFRMCYVFYARDGLDIENIFSKLGKLHSIFYVSNHQTNIHILRYNQYNHIFIGSKNYTQVFKVTKALRAYDELWLDSQACVDKIIKEMDISHLKIKLIGRPQLKRLTEGFKGEKFLLCVFEDIDNFVSMDIIRHVVKLAFKNDFFIKFILKEVKQINIFLKSFKKQLEEFLLVSNIKYQINTNISDDLIIQSRCIICDLKSYKKNSQSFLATGVPIYIYQPKNTTIETFFINQYVSLDGLYVFSCLEEFLEYFLSKDAKKEEREKFIEYWIGKSHIVNNDFQKMLAGESL
ncbi:hypothetical protein E3B40_00615 [Campylobacter coli]|nr:hypothetical protein [Campylobacter coli]